MRISICQACESCVSQFNVPVIHVDYNLSDKSIYGLTGFFLQNRLGAIIYYIKIKIQQLFILFISTLQKYPSNYGGKSFTIIAVSNL